MSVIGSGPQHVKFLRMKGDTVKPTAFRTTAAACLWWAGPHFLSFSRFDERPWLPVRSASSNQVLDWNQIFIDTLGSRQTHRTPPVSGWERSCTRRSSTPLTGSSSSATPIFIHSRGLLIMHRAVRQSSPRRTPRLLGLFPSQQPSLDARYDASVAALTERCRGLAASWMDDRAARDASSAASSGESKWRNAVLGWRASDGFSASYQAFTGGTAVGQWRPTPPAFGPMSAQGLAFTDMFVLVNNTQFQPEPPRTLTSSVCTPTTSTRSRRSAGGPARRARTTRRHSLPSGKVTPASTGIRPRTRSPASHHLSMSRTNRLLAVLNIAMADTAFTIWSAKRFYGSLPTELTWRPVTAIPLADTDGNPDTAPDADWLPLVTTPSHPASSGHPGQNGAAATVLLSYFSDRQTFTLTTTGQPNRTYSSISTGARRWEQRPRLGWHALARARSPSATR